MNIATISNEYYEYKRHIILPLLPTKFDRILDIGCGMGNTLAWIKAYKGCECAVGVELVHDAAVHARQKIDAVFEGDIEHIDLPIQAGSLDVILCLDVLEHLVNPWQVVKRLHTLLKYDGVIIASIPNVRNFRVVLPLLLRGKWDYTNAGLLDKTHLRFFTIKTAINLMQCSGLRVDMVKETGFDECRKVKIANTITFSLLKHLFSYQYLIRAKNIDK